MWQGADTDGDTLSYNLFYSADNGLHWQVLGLDITRNEFDVNLNDLAGSDEAMFRVTATDGVNTAEDTSDSTLTVAQKPPVVRIISPEENSEFSSRRTVLFAGEVTDVEDGLLEDDSLIWESSLQGVLGTGRLLSTAALIPGNHTITLTATDKNGLTDAIETTIRVVPSSPFVDAGPDQWVASNSIVKLDGTKSSGFGTNQTQVSYSWKQVEGPSVGLSSDSEAQSSFTAPSVQSDTKLAFELNVATNSLQNATGRVGVTVMPIWKPFNVTAEENGEFYEITGLSTGSIPNSVDINPGVSMAFGLDSTEGGIVNLNLPIDAVDGIFQVTSDGVQIAYNISRSERSNNLIIHVPSGAGKFEVLGTFVTPEFPSGFILGIATVIAGVIGSRKFSSRLSRWFN